MPELPEVETIVSDLRKVLPKMRFQALTWEHKNSVSGALELVDNLNGAKVLDVLRRGKYINILFSGDFVMTIHLRMSGRLIFAKLDEGKFRFERTRIDFDRGSLRFCDIRKFGKVWISKVKDHEAVTGISRLGVEPLSEDFDYLKFKSLLGKNRGNVKKNLLDQSLIAGIGNIYADEACFYAGIKPMAVLAELSEKKLEKLFEGVLKALRQGVKNRGTSISDFVDAYGQNGSNQELLYVYGRSGKPCLNCKSLLKREVVAGRGTVYCEKCQS